MEAGEQEEVPTLSLTLSSSSFVRAQGSATGKLSQVSQGTVHRQHGGRGRVHLLLAWLRVTREIPVQGPPCGWSEGGCASGAGS